MLQIRLSKPASETGATAKPASADTVTVACPDHLVLADLPVAKSLGSACATAVVKMVGRRSRRQLGERVHFCVRCDFPIAIYGRLSPCDHCFCLDCARSDQLCYLCDERIQKIQTIKMMEGIFICAAPHCLKSFLKKTEFESHINEMHSDLLHPKERDGNELEATSARRPTASDSTVQAPPIPGFSPSSNSQVHDRDNKTQHLPSKDQPLSRPVMQLRQVPPFGQSPNHASDQHADSNQSHPFDRSASQNRFPQQGFDPQGGLRNDSVNPNPNPVMPPPQFGYAPYPSDGTQSFYGGQYEIPKPDAAPESGQGQGPVLNFQSGPPGPLNFPPNYPQQWNMGPGFVPLEPPQVPKGNADGFMNVDTQGRGLFPGSYGQNMGMLPPNLPPAASSNVEQTQGGHYMDPRDGKGVLSSQPAPLLPPPPAPLPHMAQLPRGRPYSGDGNRDTPPPGFI